REDVQDLPHGDSAARSARPRRGLDLHVLADARRLHHAGPRRRGGLTVHRQRRPQLRRDQQQRAARGGIRDAAGDRHGRLPRDRQATRRVRGPLMETRATRIGLGAATTLVIAFLWVPILIILAYAFNGSVLQTWPIQNLTLHWFHEAWVDQEVRSSLWLSVKIGLIATVVAMVLGTAASFAISRFPFFGREGISFLLLLPIALPGIITGMALSSFYNFAGIGFSIWTIVIGHATFCVVVVYNNVLARLRRTSPSIVEASMDLGADGWQTFRF